VEVVVLLSVTFLSEAEAAARMIWSIYSMEEDVEVIAEVSSDAVDVILLPIALGKAGGGAGAQGNSSACLVPQGSERAVNSLVVIMT
jgi:hypothetical protein